MARPRQVRTLGVWMNGEHVGEWHSPSDGRHEFRYAPAWFESPHARPISIFFPLRPPSAPYRQGVESFFENLLPDSRAIRERIQRRFTTRSASAFDLLSQIGRDCVGALQLLPEGEEPGPIRQITGHRLSPDAIAQLLSNTLEGPAAGSEPEEDTFRISIAGAQEKTALLWHRKAWHRPTGNTPTTHILKLPIGTMPGGIDLSTSVENEWLCAQILKAFGIPVAECRIESFGGFKTLVVERFDRKLAPDRSWWIRLPQEDFCQATGTPPARKYEADGGPGIRKILEILLGSEDPAQDRRDFLRTQLVFWLLAATDGHAKNFSLLLKPGGSYRLTPRYDVLSAHPMIGTGLGKVAPQKLRMAMAVWGGNRHYRWKEIQPRHWLETARQCGVTGMREIAEELCDRTPTVLTRAQSSIPRGFPAPLANGILSGLKHAADTPRAGLTGIPFPPGISLAAPRLRGQKKTRG